MLHIYPMRGIFYLPSIDTGTRDRQFNVSSERHPAGILLMKVLRFLGFTARGSNPGPPAQQASILTTTPPSCTKILGVIIRCMFYKISTTKFNKKVLSVLHVLDQSRCYYCMTYVSTIVVQ